MPPKNKKDRTVSAADQNPDDCGTCNNAVLSGTSVIECASCVRWFHQKCTDLAEETIKAIDGYKSIQWYCNDCLHSVRKFLLPKGLEAMDQKLDTLIESNRQHQKSLSATITKFYNATNVTTVSTESITKLSNDLSALLPAINKVAHGRAPKISSVKVAVEKMSSTYATATNKGAAIQTETCTITTKPRDVNGVLIIENADLTFRNSSDTKRSFSKAFPKKKLLYAFRTTRGHIHLEFETHDESKEIEDAWRSNFLGKDTVCRRPRTLQKNFSVIIKDVPKEDDFTDTNISSSLQPNYPEAKARRFIRKDSTILNTVKIDFRSHKDMEAAVRDGLFLNDQFFRACEFKEDVKIPIVRCYNCQKFGHIAKTCRSPPKCSNCSGPHSTSECDNTKDRKCANCQSNHYANDPNCEAYLNHASKVYNQRNIPTDTKLPSR